MPPVINLLCLPCAGASAMMYLRWRRHLPAWIRVVPVELPGRGSRLAEPLADDFDRLIAQLCNEQAHAMQGSYVLFGHSMGALLAYGMAERQRELSRVLPHLMLVSASSAPSLRNTEYFSNKDTDAALIADLRKQGGTPDEVFACEELLRITLDTLSADYRVCQSYCHRTSHPTPVPLHVLAGRQDGIRVEQIEGWLDETSAAFALDWFDGGHFFIREQEPQVLDVIVRALKRLTQEVERASVATA